MHILGLTMTTQQITDETKHKTTMDVKVKLSLLWIIVMLNMIYADILAFVSAYIKPGVIEQLMNGYSGNVKLSQELLFISALLIEIPILMIILSRTLKYQINRWANIVASILSITFVIGGVETDPFFLFLASIEILVMLYIIWIVLSWKESVIKY